MICNMSILIDLLGFGKEMRVLFGRLVVLLNKMLFGLEMNNLFRQKIFLWLIKKASPESTLLIQDIFNNYYLSNYSTRVKVHSLSKFRTLMPKELHSFEVNS